MHFSAVRLNAHVLNVILSARRCLCLHFWRCDPSHVLNAVLAGLSSRAKASFNMHDGRYIHHSRYILQQQNYLFIM